MHATDAHGARSAALTWWSRTGQARGLHVSLDPRDYMMMPLQSCHNQAMLPDPRAAVLSGPLEVGKMPPQCSQGAHDFVPGTAVAPRPLEDGKMPRTNRYQNPTDSPPPATTGGFQDALVVQLQRTCFHPTDSRCVVPTEE